LGYQRANGDYDALLHRQQDAKRKTLEIKR